jgi:hypothetical protein
MRWLAALVVVTAACEAPVVPVGARFGAEVCDKTPCNDGNSCTEDHCDPTRGCQFTPRDGQPCGDGAPCLVTPVCDGSVCKGPAGFWRIPALVAKTTDDVLHGLCATPDGGFAAVGEVRQSEILGISQTENLFLRVAPDGTLAAQTVMTGKEHDDALFDVARLPDGRYLGVGKEAAMQHAQDVTPVSNIAWAVLDDHGVGQARVAKTPALRSLAAVAIAQDGSPLAVGRSDGQGLIVRFFKDLQEVQWAIAVPGPTQQEELLGVAEVRDAAVGWLAVGYAKSGVTARGVLQRIGPEGPTQSSEIVPQGLGLILVQVVPLADGGSVVLGRADATHWPGWPETTRLFLARTDASLQVAWQRIGPVGQIANDLVQWPGDGPLTVAMATTGPSAALQRWDLQGHGGVLRTGFATAPTALAVLAGDRLGMVSNGSYSGQMDSFVERTDPWGAESCADSGICAARTATACAAGCGGGDCRADVGCVTGPVDPSACSVDAACPPGGCP